jgi:hypothetical protein
MFHEALFQGPWPGILSNAGVPAMSTTSFALQKGESKTITASASWGGRFWGRTHCSQDSTGKFSCVTGDCGFGKIECSGNGGALLATLAEFTLDGAGGLDFFNVSLATTSVWELRRIVGRLGSEPGHLRRIRGLPSTNSIGSFALFSLFQTQYNTDYCQNKG